MVILYSPRTTFCGVLFFLFFLCAPLPLSAQVIDVDLFQEHQTMDGTGGNAYGFITGSNWSSNVINLITTDINVSHVRFRSTIESWEPSNDNTNANSINWGAFNDSSVIHQDFVLCQKLSQAGIEQILGIWSVPGWMVTNPGASSNRIIPPHLYSEFGELIASYIIYARDNYDANITAISIQNEPNIGIYNYFSSSELPNVTEAVLDSLDHFGLGYVKLHVGDVNEPGSALAYYSPSMNRPDIASRTQAVSYHTWHSMSPSVLNSVRDFAEGYGISNWATEVGYSSLDSSTFNWAIGSMENHHLAMVHSNANMTFQWTLGGAETSISKSGTPYPVYYALKHIHQHIFPGTVRVGTSGGGDDLLTTAFMDKADKKLSIVTINKGYASANATIDLAAFKTEYKALDIFKTTSSHKYQKMGTVNVGTGQRFSYPLEARSIHTFSGHYNRYPLGTLTSAPHPTNPSMVNYTYTLTEPDGVQSDNLSAGMAFFYGTTHLATITNTMPSPPSNFNVSLGTGGEVLILELKGMPKSLGITLVAGALDKDNGSCLHWTQM